MIALGPTSKFLFLGHPHIQQIKPSRQKRYRQHSRHSPFLSGSVHQHNCNISVKVFFEGTELGCDLAKKDPPSGCELATFAGGTFWGLQLAFDRVHGVIDTQDTPLHFRHRPPLSDQGVAALQVVFDPEKVEYEALIDELFRHIDPTTLNQQREDIGTLYRSGIYYHSAQQRKIATQKLKQLQQDIKDGAFRETVNQKVTVELKPAGDFYVAENIHQKYLEHGGRTGELQSAEKGCQDPIKWFV